MPEIEIKRVNFFDGQFLKDAEFKEFDLYHRHMRRRWAYMMFDKSGVVQAKPSDLTLVPDPANGPSDKKILVKRGMAIGMVDDAFEGREIVLRTDEVLDLAEAKWGLTAGDTAVFTIHYKETFSEPRDDGDESGDTRIKEEAIVLIHKNDLAAAPALPDGNVYVLLGGVKFDDLSPPDASSPAAQRDRALLNTALFAAAPTIELHPNNATAGGTIPPVIIEATGLNLFSPALTVTVPSTSLITVSNLNVVDSKHLSIKLTIPIGATSTTITVDDGTNDATASFTVDAGLTLSSVASVNELNGVTDIVINGSGFDENDSVDLVFEDGSTLTLPASRVDATQIRIPMTDIPPTVGVGQLDVSQAGVHRQIELVPPAVVDGFEDTLGNTVPTVSMATPGLLKIVGDRFLLPLQVRVMKNQGGTLTQQFVRDTGTGTNFPSPFSGESIAPTKIVVRLPNTVSGSDFEIYVTTGDGTATAAGNGRGGTVRAGIISA